jgi:acid phosphatase (class A)
VQRVIVKNLLFPMVIWLFIGCSLEHESVYPQKNQAAIKNSGYLKSSQLPSSLAIIPTVPTANSATMVRDRIVSKNALKLRGTKRWELAMLDAVLDFPQAADTFSCTLGVPITKENTPHTYNLLQKLYKDAKASTHPAKEIYHRKRPFMVNGKPTCTPKWEPKMRKSGSYPSGHSAIGWAAGLTLAQVDPDQASQILARAVAYSESRVVCNAHWYSDIVWGRVMGASTVAKLHSDPKYQKEIKMAQNEIKDAKKRGLKPARDCRFESEALLIKLYR